MCTSWFGLGELEGISLSYDKGQPQLLPWGKKLNLTKSLAVWFPTYCTGRIGKISKFFNFKMLFQFLLKLFFYNELFSCLQEVNKKSRVFWCAWFCLLFRKYGTTVFSTLWTKNTVKKESPAICRLEGLFKLTFKTKIWNQYGRLEDEEGFANCSFCHCIIKVTLIIIIIIKLKGDLTTYKKLLNICLVSSDEREFENVMKEQKTAAHAAHLS